MRVYVRDSEATRETDLPPYRTCTAGFETMDLPVRDWASLPKHLLDSILERLLLPEDYLRFSSVCMSWHCVADECKRKRVRMTAPMLLIYTGKKSTWSLYDIMENKVLPMQVRVPNNRFCGSSKGWLICVDKYFAVTLINPFFRVKGSRKKENSIIHLPPLNPYGRKKTKMGGYFFYKAMISADPLVNPNDCIVLVIFEHHLAMAFIRLGMDSAWNYIDEEFPIETRCPMIKEVVYFEDKFYAMDNWSNLLCFSITAQSISEIELVAHGVDQGVVSNMKYLVNSNEKDLLMVHRYTDSDEWEEERHYKRKTVGFKVFKMNFEKSEWVEEKNLGDIALFVGDNSSVSVLSSGWSGCQPNCIYYSHGWDRISIDLLPAGPLDFGVYDVKNQRFSETCGTLAKTLVKMTKRLPIWVMLPTFQL